MILEIVRIDVRAGLEAEFEHNVAESTTLFKRAKGCHGVAVRRSVERPSRYWLLVRWETVENHTDDFAKSEDFRTFGNLVGHCFAAAPQVDHAAEIWTGF